MVDRKRDLHNLTTLREFLCELLFGRPELNPANKDRILDRLPFDVVVKITPSPGAALRAAKTAGAAFAGGTAALEAALPPLGEPPRLREVDAHLSAVEVVPVEGLEGLFGRLD
jgi:hypothetical protein